MSESEELKKIAARNLATIVARNRLKKAAPELLELVKRSAHLFAESAEANEPRVAAHRDHLVAAIKALDPEYCGRPI